MQVEFNQRYVYVMTNDTFILEVTELSHRFHSSGCWLFENIDLRVSAGESVAITGLSGAGKTSLLQLISGLSPFQQGSVNILGKPLDQLSAHEIVSLRRNDMGFVYQNALLLSALTVYENIALPGMRLHRSATALHTQVSSLIDAFDLAHCMERMPHLLSGGEKARVCIARALVNQPRLLFADEPTGNLDAVNAKRIMDYILALKEVGTAVVVITHDLALAQTFDVHYCLNNGSLTRVFD